MRNFRALGLVAVAATLLAVGCDGHPTATEVQPQFTVVEPASIGDRVWLDLNHDGIQDIGEPGIPGITVNLYGADLFSGVCSADVMATTVTDSNGFYSFTGLWTGDYCLGFTVPDGSSVSPQDQGSDDVADSDIDPLTGMTVSTNLEFGEADMSWDAGLFIPDPEECGECDGKVTQLTLLYTGTEPVVIRAFDDKKEANPDKLMFEATVQPGETFTINGTGREGEMGAEIGIWVGEMLVKIHTSCSQPIGPGMVFGPLEVIEGYSRNGGLLCPVDQPGGGECGACDGKVSQLTLKYTGAEAVFLEIFDDKKNPNPDKVMFEGMVQPGEEITINGTHKKGEMGAEIGVWADGQLLVKIHTSCSQPIGPGAVFGPLEVLEGYSRNGGKLCPMDPPGGGECQPCDGKVSQLTLRFTGTEAAFLEVFDDKKNPAPDKLMFEGTVEPGQEFTFSGTHKKGEMGSEISLYLDGTLVTKIHTSCSKPIGPGMVFGEFEVVEGYSRNGGLLCPAENGECGDGWCELGKAQALTVQYTGESCSATSHNQDPEKVQCEGDPASLARVHILVVDKENPTDEKAKTWFDGEVDLNGDFMMDAANAGESKVGAKTFAFIYDLEGNLLQFVEFHTSCSQPLGEDDQFGSLKLIGFTPNI